MPSMYDQPVLSPAQAVKRQIEIAQAAALIDDWKQYEEENAEALRAVRGEKPKRDYGPIVHGTRRGYRRGCKCGPCKRANTNYTQRYRHENGLTSPRAKHGTHKRFMLGCRCAECREYRNANNRRYWARKKEREQVSKQENALQVHADPAPHMLHNETGHDEEEIHKQE